MKWIDELDGEFNGKPCKIKVGISDSYSESAVLELTKMVLNINENNIVGFDSIGRVCIGNGYLAQMKDLAKEIIADCDWNKEWNYD